LIPALKENITITNSNISALNYPRLCANQAEAWQLLSQKWRSGAPNEERQ
jgi:hypothetical protein